MSGEHIIQVNAGNWQSDVIDSGTPVLVDFWAEWCGPCRAIAPFLDELADDLDGKLKIAKVNVDENAELATQFGVRSIPTLILFKDGERQEQMVGAATKAAIRSKVEAHLG